MFRNRGWKNNIVWFLFAQGLSAFIIVIRNEEQDQDGGSMINKGLYCGETFIPQYTVCHDACRLPAAGSRIYYCQ